MTATKPPMGAASSSCATTRRCRPMPRDTTTSRRRGSRARPQASGSVPCQRERSNGTAAPARIDGNPTQHPGPAVVCGPALGTASDGRKPSAKRLDVERPPLAHPGRLVVDDIDRAARPPERCDRRPRSIVDVNELDLTTHAATTPPPARWLPRRRPLRTRCQGRRTARVARPPLRQARAPRLRGH